MQQLDVDNSWQLDMKARCTKTSIFRIPIQLIMMIHTASSGMMKQILSITAAAQIEWSNK